MQSALALLLVRALEPKQPLLAVKAAGISVAMGNAIHGIQAFCNIITTDIRDNGLANAFKTLGLA